MPSAGSRPSVVEPTSSGRPTLVLNHGLCRVSAGDASRRSSVKAANTPVDALTTVNAYQSG